MQLHSPRQRQRGVTLIELMVAVSITAVITLGLLFALRTSVTAYEKTGDRLRANREQLSRNQILSRELGGIIPITNICESRQMPFLMGTAESLRVVSSYSIAEGARGYPQILEFHVGRSQSGGLQLVVIETPYTGPGSTSAFCGAPGESVGPVEGSSRPFVLADDLAECVFSYKPPRNPLSGQPAEWAPEWTVENTRMNGNMLPAAIKVEMRPRAAVGGGVPTVSVIAPMRVDRDIFRGYID
jgi:prepilin-type N-terminal cleavage/methylation domain-containing protein